MTVLKTYADDCLSDEIKSARASKGLTQPQLAGRLGITTRYLKLIENSGRKPSYRLLVLIIHELDISTDRIFNYDNDKL